MEELRILNINTGLIIFMQVRFVLPKLQLTDPPRFVGMHVILWGVLWRFYNVKTTLHTRLRGFEIK